jgi:hypothetical protein
MADEVIIKTDKTTIPIKKITRDRIKAYGKKGESWDDLMNRIMDEISIGD